MSESLRRETLQDVMEAIAAKQPTPGGGATAATAAALGAATARMTLNYSVGKKALSQHKKLHDDAAGVLEKLSRAAMDWMDEDAAAYAKLNALWKLPADDAVRKKEFPAAVEAAIDAPMNVLRGAVELLQVLDALRGATNDQLNSDFAIAAICGEAAARAAAWNVRINLSGVVSDVKREALRNNMEELLRDARVLHESVVGHCEGVGGVEDDAAD